MEDMELDNRRSPRTDDSPHANSATSTIPTPQLQRPHGIRLAIITIGLILSIFLAALDQSIVATAIPSITDQFGSIGNIAWYGSAYTISNSALQSCWGKAYRYFDLKTTFLVTIAVFEAGNVVCATAQSSEVLIFGRVLAGMGGGGVMTGVFIIIALTATDEYRAAYMGLLGVTYGTASVVGPLMGGALTDGPGWRWCFWVFLPVGFSAAAIMFFVFRSPMAPQEASPRERIVQMDLGGGLLAVATLSFYVLAMHWSGIYSWGHLRVILSLLGFGLSLSAYVLNEWWMGDKAMVQARFFKNKVVAANLGYIFFLAGAFFPLLYTLPVQFQSVNNNSASQSGIRLIPLVLGVSVFTMIANGALTWWRHYKPFLLVGALLATAGACSIYTLDATTSTQSWIGYEVLTATGVGLALQIPMIANQANVVADDIASVTALTLFVENCGTSLFIASGEAAFTQGLLGNLARNMPEIDPHEVLNAGVTQIRNIFSGGELDEVLSSYLHGCKVSHILSVGCGVAASLISLSNAGPAAVKEVKMRLKKSHST
ncbi:MFS gliotoxin efflux transporter glia [Polyplosphaeria fusca]|uniref:MFS gliotoxin efflux transporter glia n=1 Tax=Polyplosphaeria fusca TaxID=682080 RepID=A0A9P4V0N8_9PLEO|nr:MFS gliotoxin efflux transporter glia [Polyplosphaeria fusca]